MTRSARILVTHAACLVFVVFCGASPRGQAQEANDSGVTVQKVIAAWQKREQGIRSAKIEWTETRTDFRHGYFYIRTKEYWPENDTTYEGTLSVIIGGRRARVSHRGTVWSSLDGSRHLAPRDYTTTFNGEVSKEFHAATQKDIGDYPRGTIRAEKENFWMTTSHVLPISWFCRPLDPHMGGFDRDRLAVTGDTGVIDGRSCAIIGVKRGEFGPYEWKLWLDPAANFVIRRAYRFNRDGTLENQFDLSYAANGQSTIAVKEWKHLNFWGEKLQTEMVCRITQWTINPPVADEDFEIVFPPGTWVTDLRGGNLRRGKEKQFIVHEKTPDRVLLESDIGASYEQLLNSEPGKAHTVPPNGSRRSTWYHWTIGAGVLVLAFVCFRMARQRLRTINH